MSIERLLVIGLVLFPLLGAAAALTAGLGGRQRAAVVLAGGGIVLAVIAAVALLPQLLRTGTIAFTVGGWSASTGIGLILDLPAGFILLVIGLVTAAIYVYAIGSGHGTTVFVVVFSIAQAGLAAVVLAEDLFNLFVALEVVSLAAVILIAYQRSTRALYAAFRYLVISTVSIALYLTGLLALYRITGELALSRIAAVLAHAEGHGDMRGVAIAVVLIVTGLATRVAIVPFHAWLPDAHSSAPHPVSALLSGLVLKAGFFALWRVARILPPAVGRLDVVLLMIGALSASFGVVLALAQSDAKRLLAFHSISQMGLIVIGAAAGLAVNSADSGVSGTTGALFHSMSHAAFKSLLFLVVGVMVVRWKTHDLYVMRERNRGVAVPWVEQALFLVGAGAIAGVPGLSGYVGKTMIAGSLKDIPVLYLLVKVVSAGTVASFIKLGTVFFPGREYCPAGRGRIAITHPGTDSRLPMLAGMTLLAGITVALGAGGAIMMNVLSMAALIDSVLVTAGGIGIYLLIRTGRGRAIGHCVDQWRLGLDAALICILAGTAAMAVVI